MGTLKVDNLQKRDGTALITDGAASTTLLSQASLRSAGVGLIKISTQTVSDASSNLHLSGKKPTTFRRFSFHFYHH